LPVLFFGTNGSTPKKEGHCHRRLLFTPEYRERFLDQCYRFDSQPWVCGLGKDNLVASGVKRSFTA
jgi:hypothetical protein